METKIRDELLTVKGKKTLLQPQAVVDWARSRPDSAIHQALEWDDTVAGELWRRQQVRRLISLCVTTEEGDRALVSLSIDRVEPQGGYRTISDVLASPRLRDVLLSDALAEFERLEYKYGRLKQLAGVWTEVRKVKAKNGKPKRAMRSRAHAEPSRAHPR